MRRIRPALSNRASTGLPVPPHATSRSCALFRSSRARVEVESSLIACVEVVDRAEQLVGIVARRDVRPAQQQLVELRGLLGRRPRCRRRELRVDPDRHFLGDQPGKERKLERRSGLRPTPDHRAVTRARELDLRPHDRSRRERSSPSSTDRRRRTHRLPTSLTTSNRPGSSARAYRRSRSGAQELRRELRRERRGEMRIVAVAGPSGEVGNADAVDLSERRDGATHRGRRRAHTRGIGWGAPEAALPGRSRLAGSAATADGAGRPALHRAVQAERVRLLTNYLTRKSRWTLLGALLMMSVGLSVRDLSPWRATTSVPGA